MQNYFNKNIYQQLLISNNYILINTTDLINKEICLLREEALFVLKSKSFIVRLNGSLKMIIFPLKRIKDFTIFFKLVNFKETCHYSIIINNKILNLSLIELSNFQNLKFYYLHILFYIFYFILLLLFILLFFIQLVVLILLN